MSTPSPAPASPSSSPSPSPPLSVGASSDHGAASAPAATYPTLSTDASTFCAELPELTEFSDVFEAQRYAEVPHDALLVLTDVRGSTRAIESGRYRDVNALGVASIVAVCNAMRDLELPYVFGGDGATLLVPGSRRASAERALRGVRALAESAFGLGLRVGVVPVAELRAAGYAARAAWYRSSPHARLAAFSGSAFSAAERWVKDATLAPAYEVSADGESEASFDGFECRWQPLGSRRGAVVALLVSARAEDEAARAETYRDLLRAFERIVGGEAYAPVVQQNLRLSGFRGDYSIEARIRSQVTVGPSYEAALSSARRQTLIGRALTATRLRAGSFDGARYKSELCANTDYRKYDDMLRMVVDLNRAELYRFESRLAAEQRAGRVAYGLHSSEAALITCLVRSYRHHHVHFVDGSDGGYALAAKQLKAALAK